MAFDVIRDQLRRHLSDDHLGLLSDLFQSMKSYNDGTDALLFEVKHRQIEGAIHELYQKSLIQRRPGPNSKNVYRPALLALPLIEIQTARVVEITCDAIVKYLHSAFIDDPYVRLTVADLAAHISADEKELVEALRYLRDMPLGLIAITDDAPLHETDNVPIIKAIMEYPTLLEVYKKLLQWAMSNSSDMSYFTAQGGPTTTPLVGYVDEILASGVSSNINAEIIRVLQELRLALFHELHTLSTVGIRTIIDMIVDDQSRSDLGSFKNKIQWLTDQQFIPELDRKHLLEVIDLGNSAAHRGYRPSAEHLETALVMLTHLAQRIYTMPARIDAMKRDKPHRRAKRKPQRRPS